MNTTTSASATRHNPHWEWENLKKLPLNEQFHHCPLIHSHRKFKISLGRRLTIGKEEAQPPQRIGGFQNGKWAQQIFSTCQNEIPWWNPSPDLADSREIYPNSTLPLRTTGKRKHSDVVPLGTLFLEQPTAIISFFRGLIVSGLTNTGLFSLTMRFQWRYSKFG